MRVSYAGLFVAAGLMACTQNLRADSFLSDGMPYTGTINGIRNGKLSMTIRGVERQYELDQVKAIALDSVPKFVEAEGVRSEDPKRASALYRQLIPGINKAEIRQLAEWRAVEPTDKDGRWVEAVTLFLDVYPANPAEALWNGRPTHFPAAGSSMLTESADKVAAAVKVAKSEEAKKNLKTYLVEIYTRAGDTQAAQRVAKELTTGVVEDSAASTGGTASTARPSASSAAVSGGIARVEDALNGRQFDAAIAQIDALLPGAGGDQAVQLFVLKARACEGQGKLEDAAAVLLRVPAHYPSNPVAPGALLRAAALLRRLDRPDAAKNIYREIIERYPDSPEATAARGQ